MKDLGLIAAIGPNYELGKDNQLLWYIKEDLAFYKSMTMGKHIIMGRKTLESMPMNALVGRISIVLSKSSLNKENGILYFDNINELLQYINNSQESFMVIGGASIYRQFLDYVDYMYLTHVTSLKQLEADCYFPKFLEEEWNCEPLKNGTSGEYSYQICKYMKRKVLKKNEKEVIIN